MASPGGSVVKNLPAMQETQVRSLDWEHPLEEEMAIPVFLPGKSHGQRSLAGHNPWGHKESDKESDMTERTHTLFPNSVTRTHTYKTKRRAKPRE